MKMKKIMAILFIIFLAISLVNSLELSKYFLSGGILRSYRLFSFSLIEKLSSCQTALGMQSGSIPDSSISASSSYDSNSVGPKASR